MQPSDLFPTCADRTCPDKGQHKHLLPHQDAFFKYNERYIYTQGGYGASKTIQACAKGILLTLSIPGNRGVVIRDTYPKLHDSTQRVFMECMERGRVRGWKGRENRDGWYHRLIFPNKSEVFFREARNLGRFLGPEYGWFLIDEALEVSKEVFKKLQGRLRLAAALGYHSGMLLSNPPHQNHWLHDVFGEEPRSWAVEVDMGDRVELSTFRYEQVSTRANPHNPPGYLADLLTGLTQAEIQRLVEGDYGYIPEGPPVYPMFQHHRHVGVPALREHSTLARVWDFGFRHPTVTFHDFWTCRKSKIHWSVLDAMDGKMVETVEWAKGVLDYTTKAWPKLDPVMVEDAGDASGVQHTITGMPGPIALLNGPPFFLEVQHRKTDVLEGIDLIRTFLKLPACECGASRFLIHRKVRYVIEGFQGGYHMRREVPGKAAKEEPHKDGFYDDYMDSVRYAAEHFLRQELIDVKLIDTLDKTDPRRMYKDRGRDPWQQAIMRMIEHARKG